MLTSFKRHTQHHNVKIVEKFPLDFILNYSFIWMTSWHSLEVKTKSIWIKTSEDIETAQFKKQVNKNLPTESSLHEYHPCIIVAQEVEAEIMGTYNLISGNG